jgi:hypothetical protein
MGGLEGDPQRQAGSAFLAPLLLEGREDLSGVQGTQGAVVISGKMRHIANHKQGGGSVCHPYRRRILRCPWCHTVPEPRAARVTQAFWRAKPL